ncbi:MAG: 4-hydroxybenzoate polyprenyltransferase [Phycisphaerales bacterium]|jgi:4-hydroxybenzoate polyprenyltransferase
MGRKPYQHVSEFQGWLNMLRISNSPTVVSNAMVGLAFVIQAHTEFWSERITPPALQMLVPLTLIVVVLLLLYFAGMVLGDAYDVERDTIQRPDRSIPSGIITSGQAWSAGYFMVGLAILVAFGISITAGISTSCLALSVLLYTYLHHTKLLAIPLMGLCRGLTIIVAVSAFSSDYFSQSVWWYVGALSMYTAILTFIGTYENYSTKKTSGTIVLMVFPLGIAALAQGSPSPIAIGATIVFCAWMVYAWKNFRKAEEGSMHGMHTLLSGFALLDCVCIASLGEYHIMVIPAFCFVLTVAAHRKILGT